MAESERVAGRLERRALTPGSYLRPHEGPVILVGFDGGPSSLRAAAFSIGLASRQRALLLFLMVWKLPTSCGMLPPLLANEPEAVAMCQATLHTHIADLIGDQPVRWELHQSVGHLPHELKRVASEIKADAIIVGSSPRRLRRLLGSVGSSLARSGRCPVTVVP